MTIDLSSLLTKDLQLDASACAGQVIVVTGAGRGIGLQTARAFALLGGKVVLAELSEAGREAEKQIRADRDVPKETARFTRDEDMLRQITAVTQQRLSVIQQVREQLKA